MPRQQFTFQCSTCATTFLLNHAQLARLRKNPHAHVYCSRKCSGTALAEATCSYAPCGRKFHPNGTQRARMKHGGPTFCSIACFQQSRVTYNCGTCGNVFFATEWQRRRAAKGEAIQCGACKSKRRTSSQVAVEAAA